MKSSGAWQMCYPKSDLTLGAHTWGLSAWVGRLQPWDTASQYLRWARRVTWPPSGLL